MTGRRIAPAVREAMRAAKQEKVVQRARLIDAGIIAPKPGRKNKYNRVKVVYNGETYDSLGEAEFAAKLDIRKLAGDILDWKRAPSFVVMDAEKARDRISYTPDFEVWTSSKVPYYIDFKGSSVDKYGKRRAPTETQAFRLRVKMWKQTVPYKLIVAYADGTEKILCDGKLN